MTPGYADLAPEDVMISIMDGCQAMCEIRKMDDTVCFRIPIIAMTANAFDADVPVGHQAFREDCADG